MRIDKINSLRAETWNTAKQSGRLERTSNKEGETEANNKK